MSVATRAIVALVAYGPKGFEPGVAIPQGAEEVSGTEQMVAAVRRQIAAGADGVKLYADYRWRAGEDAQATLSIEEIKAAVAAAHDGGRPVAVHASTAEGMRRAVEAGVDTIEHGYGGTPAIDASMASKGIALCATLAAADASARYRGWDGAEPAPAGVRASQESFRTALAAGVPICIGGLRRRLRAWHERSRNGADGGGGNDAGTGFDRCDHGQRTLDACRGPPGGGES